MGIKGIQSAMGLLKPAQVQSAAQVQVFKNALDSQAQGTQQLLQSMPKSPAGPAHLGQNIDVYYWGLSKRKN